MPNACHLAVLAAAAMIVSPLPAAAAQAPEPAEAKAAGPMGSAEIRAMIEEMRAEILKPGEILEGWNVGGADPDAEMRSKGAENHFFLSDEAGEREVSILTHRRIDDFAPRRWRPIDSYGSPVAYAEDPSVQFSALSSRYFIGMRGASARQQGVSCSKGVTHAILYEDSEAPAGDVDAETAIGMFRIALLAMEGQTVCARYDGDGERGWRAHYLLPDGRSLPELNKEETRVTIVPAAPIETLVRVAPKS